MMRRIPPPRPGGGSFIPHLRATEPLGGVGKKDSLALPQRPVNILDL
ncbi:hypothetical protein [Moorena sp. SIO3E8]|nr:hypothetical protein [Moorena sp. SIO3E8]NEO47990.1 hypothetical protein [Moorena sp. SIO4A3]